MASKKKIIGLVSELQKEIKFLKGQQGAEEQLGIYARSLEELRTDFQEMTAEHGESTVLLTLLEDCILLLHKLEQPSLEPEQKKQAWKHLQTFLKKLLFEMGRLLPEDKKELVFFPYLYAMWDSLESIWRAAVTSGEYLVSVVAIPYYERNADGSLGHMHYDGGDYPPEVGVIPWEEYHVAERKPAVAYVHNPYDDWNRVTSIHPDFYSGKLKPHVGSLVYVPYFVVNHDMVPDHFCVTPVTLRADKIIVQSEKTREIYISNLLNYSKENKLHWTKKYLEEKVLPLGSPKYDKVKTQDEVLETVPASWKSVIFREDGTRKKVIFFNTSISTLLEFDTLALERLEDTLMMFYLAQKDIAMLWRPHPLIEATYQSMKPHLYEKYLRIKQTYLQGHWGILDESKEFDRAVCLSDGYYGDTSSVVAVFRQSGKPVMTSNCHINLKE